MNRYKLFKQLHQQPEPLIIGNVWNVSSARLFERNAFKAIATSSWALAATLGYSDGEEMPYAELLYMVERISKCVMLPLSVDVEAGFSRDADVVADHLTQLYKLGVVGVNLEDSVVEGERQLLPAQVFAEKLAHIRRRLNERNVQLFINARTDAFLMQVANPLQETLERITAYQAAGADGIFVPAVMQEQDITTLVKATPLPLHVLSVPGLPAFKDLTRLGVKRISMGSAFYKLVERQAEHALIHLQQAQSVNSLFQ